MSSDKTYITLVAENINDTLSSNCDTVKKLFEEINFIENTFVSVFSCKSDPYSDETRYYQFSFLIVGNLKDEKFRGIYEFINNTDKSIPFSINGNKFNLRRLSDKIVM